MKKTLDDLAEDQKDATGARLAAKKEVRLSRAAYNKAGCKAVKLVQSSEISDEDEDEQVRGRKSFRRTADEDEDAQVAK